MSVSGARNFADPFQPFLGPETDTFCQFLGPESEPLCQFLDPENFKMSQFLFKWIFLVSIELAHNLEHVQKHFVSFSIDADPFTRFLGPESDKISQLLGPEMVKIGQQSFWPQKLTLWVNFQSILATFFIA